MQNNNLLSISRIEHASWTVEKLDPAVAFHERIAFSDGLISASQFQRFLDS